MIERSKPGVEAKGKEEAISNWLFPDLPVVDWTNESEPSIEYLSHTPEFTPEEIMEASTRLPPGKATGSDGIPNEVLRKVAQRRPQVL